MIKPTQEEMAVDLLRSYPDSLVWMLTRKRALYAEHTLGQVIELIKDEGHDGTEDCNICRFLKEVQP